MSDKKPKTLQEQMTDLDQQMKAIRRKKNELKKQICEQQEKAEVERKLSDYERLLSWCKNTGITVTDPNGNTINMSIYDKYIRTANSEDQQEQFQSPEGGAG